MSIECIELTDELGSVLREQMHQINVCSSADRVYKQQCMYSFDTAFTKTGLYINLQTYQAFGQKFVDRDAQLSNNKLYLHILSTKTEKKKPQKGAEEPTKLAIGVEGGFQTNDYDITSTYRLMIYPEEAYISLPNNDIPSMITSAVDAIILHSGNIMQEANAEWEEQLQVSKYVDGLPQLDNGVQISPDPSTWECPACKSKENLWLNLSDGYIGCGRKNWDGSGGCGEALEHFAATGKIYPLAVKLGTITPNGADVFSYASDENDMVKNPKLAQHLLHWGIHIQQMEKTEKSMNELQIDLNMNYDFDRITEAGKDLVPLTGPGYHGLKNLGNSCYMNSVVQVLISLPEIQQKYFKHYENIIATANHRELATDFCLQMSKMANGILTSDYDGQDLEPYLFRSLVGKGHAEFQTSRQQDAAEYFLHLLDFMTRSERTAGDRLGSSSPTHELFQFQLEDRIECLGSHRVKYKQRKDSMLQLSIPYDVEKQLSTEESKDADGDCKRRKIIPSVSFEDCIKHAFASEAIDDFYSSALKARGSAVKQMRMRTFPMYLVVSLRRYYVAKDWTPKKMDVLVQVPESLDLEEYRSKGLQANEEELVEDDQPEESTEVVPDEALVVQLISMGFSENGCKRAAIATSNGSPEAAMEWIFAHMEDPDFNDPPQPKQSASGGKDFDPQSIENLSAMGFTTDQAKAALSSTGGNIERAAEWLFSHMDDMDAAVATALSTSTSSTSAPGDDEKMDEPAVGQYQLKGFISHMGSNTACGHYVCHIKKDGRWAIFNDDKVAVSDSPPFDLGYVYFFQRKDLA